MSPIRIAATSVPLPKTRPDEQQRDQLAALMLDAYRKTIDDEGESLEDAFSAYENASDHRPMQGSSKSERPSPMATSRPSDCSSDWASTDSAHGPDECGWRLHR